MNLRESLEAGDGVPDPVEGREDFLYACGLVHGFSYATGRRMAVSTDAPTMTIHNLAENTQSAAIVRKGMLTTDHVAFAVKAQLEVIDHWITESDEWGPDPWPDGEVSPQTGRERTRDDDEEDIYGDDVPFNYGL